MAIEGTSLGLKVKNFGKTNIFLPLPYLLTAPKESWDCFWEKDLKELFSEISPIKDYAGKEFELWFTDYKLEESKYKNDLEAKINNDSYEAALRVKVKLVNIKTKKVKEQEVFLADFPKMTERGTFIINGVERVVIAQLIRSPGVFFTGERYGSGRLFGAKIIPNRGAWLEFETEKNGFISLKIDRKRKIAATALLRAFGVENNLSIKEYFQDVNKGDIDYIEETLKRDQTHNQSEALVEIYNRLRVGELVTPETAKELIWNMFFNFERYDLSKVGRWRMGQRLQELNSKFQIPNSKSNSKSEKKEEEITVEDRLLKLEDVIAVLREVIRSNNNPLAEPDQIDHLGSRRVRTFGELLRNRLRVGITRMERIIKDRMSTLDVDLISPSQLINPRPVMAVAKEFFASSQMSQFMDNENPLAELEHKRRLSATGPGGLTRERAGFEVRDVQPSHYGRICPIETPEGASVGLVGHLAGFANINPFGFLETPYFRVEKGVVTTEVHYLTAYEEERFVIASGAVPVDKKREIISEKVEARIKSEPGIADKSKIDFIDVSPEQFISVATSLIPFLQNDDANRALMGSNMQRQSVPLVKPEVPYVMTGVEERIARDSGQAIVAQSEGEVLEADAEHVKVKNSKTGEVKDYELRTFVRTNQYTCLHQKPMVEKGRKVKKGDVLADGGAISNGHLALGSNILVAFVPWRGENFEDAIVLSDRLVRDDVFTSIKKENFICHVRETKLGPEITTCDIPNISEERLKDLDEEGIVRIGAEVGPNDILVGKISPKGEADLTAEERLLRAIFGEKARDIKDTSLKMEHGKQGRVTGIKIFSRDAGYRLEPGIIKRIEIEIAELRKIQAGDKLAGRHGNKGIVAKVLPLEEMPFMEDGTPVDIVLNPLGVTSRMNLGQVLETHLGWAAEKLGYWAVTPSMSGANETDIKKELKLAGLPEDGKAKLFDGRTGLPFGEKITVGYIYMMKLIHMVKDKLHARSIGPYSLITQQPLGGKAQFGGQRFGEMEVWALEGYGAAHTLQEILTIKSDDVQGRATTYESILKGEKIKNPGVPASFNLLVNELKSLGLSIEVKERERRNRDE